jgi:hypothetical protein
MLVLLLLSWVHIAFWHCLLLFHACAGTAACASGAANTGSFCCAGYAGSDAGASGVCMACPCRIRYRVRQIRELMAVWEGWKRFNQPPGYQPPAWDESDIYNNVLPWTVASTAEGVTEQHLRYKIYCVAQELCRCEEELRYLPQDALNTLHYFQHQQEQLAAAQAAAGVAERAAATPVQQAVCRGKAYILRAWQARIASMQQRAAEAFQQAGWIELVT